MKKITFFLSFVFLFHFMTAQSTIHIPGDYPTIQQGIDAASPGETVLVDPGTYMETINFNGKNITVGSLYITTLDTTYISQTIIDGDATGSVVSIENGEDASTLLSGFTIINGSANSGGGIFISGSSPSINHLTVKDNTANLGGGIYLSESNADLSDILLKNNTGDGGGIACETGSPTMNNLTISNNSAPHYGGALYCVESLLSIQNSVFEHNEANNFGGAVFCWDTSNISLENITIKFNTAENGGGMSIFDSEPILKGVRISNNTAIKTGGGVSCTNSIPVFSNSNLCDVFLNNAAEGNDFFSDQMLQVELDTFSVPSPTDFYASPLGNYTFTITHAKKELTAADLYVSPDGDDSNSGISTNDPLKTIYSATALILADSTQERTIYLMEGSFSPQSNGEQFPINIPDYISLEGVLASSVIIDADSSAGVIEFLYNKSSRISNLTIQGGNTTKGAGIYAELSELDIENVKIKNNNANYGAGIFFDDCHSVLTNVLLSENTVANNGGGIYFTNSFAQIQNSTLADNIAGLAGGIHIYRSLIYLINTILWNDTPQEIAYVTSNGSGNYGLIVLNSDVLGGEDNIENPGNDTISWHESNIDEDPIFVKDGAHPFQINDGSPCIDTGTPDTTELNLPEYDLAEEVRVFNDRIDIGAYEWNTFVGMNEFLVAQLSNVKLIPNPVRNTLTVLFETQKKDAVLLQIYDASGTIVRTMFSNTLQAGKQKLNCNVQDLKPGIYVLRLVMNGEVSTRKMLKL